MREDWSRDSNIAAAAQVMAAPLCLRLKPAPREITCLCCSAENDEEEAELETSLEALMSLILRTQHSHEYLTPRLLDEAPK